MDNETAAIWVDADSCPRRIREIVARAASRCHVPARYVANRDIRLPASEYVSLEVVSGDPEAVDARILSAARRGDFVVTRDIPLAARLVERGLIVLNDRGVVYTAENVGERLSLRNFSKELREAGVYRAGGGALDRRSIHRFANALDRELRRCRKQPADGPPSRRA